MRKRLGILILVLLLAFIFPTKNINSLDFETQARIILAPLLFLGFLFPSDQKIFRCIKPWHPGDYFYDKNYKIIEVIDLKLQNCRHKCRNKSNTQNVYVRDSNWVQVHMSSLINYSKDGTSSYAKCYTPCYNEAMKLFPTFVAYCKNEEADGLYSDGSYYFGPGFNNTHNLKDTYKKNKWQIARDECMGNASNTKIRFYHNAVVKFNKLYNAYNDCLKERGY